MDCKYYVSLEAARLLKEKGYDKPTDYIYVIDGQFYSIWRNKDENMESNYYPAPTKAEVIDWLESKGIGISIIFCEIEMYEYVVESKDCYYSVVESGYKETRLEAEEAAIIKGVELL